MEAVLGQPWRGWIATPNMDELRDCDLVRLAAAGAGGAFGRLYQRHAVGVLQYLYYRVGNAELAEDLTQDIFMNAYAEIGSLKEPERFRSWLFAIARNRVANHWRSQAVRPAGTELPPDDHLLATPGWSGAIGLLEDPGDSLWESEALRTAMLALTDLQREVVLLRFTAGLSVAETAVAMGRTENAVKNLQHHALAALRRQMVEMP